MASRKGGMTMEEHEALGRELSAMNERLCQLGTLVGSRYTVAMAKHCGDAARCLGRLRAKLDDRVVVENHGEPTERLNRAYYPRS